VPRKPAEAIKVDSDFHQEYPDGDPVAAEAMATLIRVGNVLSDEIERAMLASFDAPETVLNSLAVIEGAGEPLTPSQISERTLKSSATMTNTLDLLERRGWVQRVPNPEDRRSVLVQITDEGKAIANRLLPGIRKMEAVVFANLSPAERAALVKLLGKVVSQLAAIAASPPIPLDGRRNRPARLQ
jgi:DNA-binding MarR family transcriptional regulator